MIDRYNNTEWTIWKTTAKVTPLSVSLIGLPGSPTAQKKNKQVDTGQIYCRRVPLLGCHRTISVHNYTLLEHHCEQSHQKCSQCGWGQLAIRVSDWRSAWCSARSQNHDFDSAWNNRLDTNWQKYFNVIKQIWSYLVFWLPITTMLISNFIHNQPDHKSNFDVIGAGLIMLGSMIVISYGLYVYSNVLGSPYNMYAQVTNQLCSIFVLVLSSQ